MLAVDYTGRDVCLMLLLQQHKSSFKLIQLTYIQAPAPCLASQSLPMLTLVSHQPLNK